MAKKKTSRTPKPKRLWTERCGVTRVEVWSIPELKSEAGEPLYGRAYSTEKAERIELRAGLSPEQHEATLLHERLHVVSGVYGLGLSEGKVRVIEQGLMQMARTSKRR